MLAGCEGGYDDDAAFTDEPAMRGVFSLSNETDSNDVIFFRRGDDGTLTQAASFETGGTGTGTSIIGSQQPLQVTHNNEFLLAVSPKSDELTAFRIADDGLERTDVVGTRGQKPVSVAVRNDGLVFVLNLNDGEGGLTGFRLTGAGNLIPIPGADRQLSNDPTAMPPQVEFSPNGNVLVVTERFAEDQGRIVTYTVSPEGLLGAPLITAPPGMTPFGMMFRDDGVLVVSEAFVQTPENPIPGEGKTSSFQVLETGVLEVVSPSVPALGTASRWVQISDDGRFAWVSNFASNDITTYAIGVGGVLERLHTTPTGEGPVGMATTAAGEFFYNLNANDDTIKAFRIDESDGSLTEIQTMTVPTSAFGMTGFDADIDLPVPDEEIDFAGFADFDTDLSGMLTREEFEIGLLGDAQDFAVFDANTDALLSEDEFNTALEIPDDDFTAIDTGVDGFVSETEFTAIMVDRFERLDTDADDFVTRQEFGTGLAGSGNFNMLDGDIDGVITNDEFGTAIANEFAGLDTDADGVLTGDEFDMALDAEVGFAGFDNDLDGRLSEDEFGVGFDRASFAGADTTADGFLTQDEFNVSVGDRDDRIFGDLLAL